MMRIRGATSALAAGIAVFTIVACRDDAGQKPVGSESGATAQPVATVANVASSREPGPAAADVRADSAAEPSMESETERTPSPAAEVSYDDAERVYRSGDYAAAADLFEAYTVRRPDNPWGHYMLGIAAWKAGDLERADAALRRTLEVAPDHEKGLLNLARVLLEEGKVTDALESAERVVALDSTSGQAWRVLGNARAELGSVEAAVMAYRSALALDPRDAWTMNNLGLLMIRSGRYEEALPSLARAIELRPDGAVFQNNLGIALERSGHPAEAADAFRAALAADPEYGKAGVSLERVEARSLASVPEPVDLAELARSFADQVTAWQEPEARMGAAGTGG